jgi:hypothetical protein
VAEKKSWPKIGTVRKGEYGSYIVLEKNVEILVDGKRIDLNEKRSVRLEDPRKKIEEMLEKGYIDESKAQKRREVLEQNQWLRYELIVPPPKPV